MSPFSSATQRTRRSVHRALARGAAAFTARLTRQHRLFQQAIAIRLAFQPRDSDIFLVTYPKAGTSLLQMLLYQLTSDGNLAIPHINAVVPWFEWTLVRNPDELDRMPSPRVFKTHLTLRQLPRRGRFIYAVRNPQDSCVSYFHHLAGLGGDGSSLEGFGRRFARGRVPQGSWFEHLEHSLPLASRANVMLLSYEALSQQLDPSIERIAAFCGIALTDADRDRTRRACSLEFMRQHDRLFDPRLMTQRRGASTFIRKGQSGTWVAELSPAVAAELQRRMKTTSARLRARGAIVDSLFSSAPECRGTIQVRLRPHGHDTLVVSREGRPEGVRLAQHVVLPKLERRAAAALARFGLSSGRLTVRAARRAGVDKGAQVRLAIHGSPSDRVLEVDGIVEACEVTGRFLVLRVMFQGLERSEEMVLHQISSVTAEMASPIASQPSGYVSSATP